MSTQLQLSGQLTSGPATGDAAFPSATTLAAFNLNPSTRQYNVDTGNTVNVNSPGSFVALPGVGGAVGPVTQAQVLYLRTTTPMIFRLTYQGDATPYLAYVSGLCIIEPDPSHLITLVEAKGAGVVEYLAFGQQ